MNRRARTSKRCSACDRQATATSVPGANNTLSSRPAPAPEDEALTSVDSLPLLLRRARTHLKAKVIGARPWQVTHEGPILLVLTLKFGPTASANAGTSIRAGDDPTSSA